MNEFDIEPPDRSAQLDDLVRDNPTQSILWALGAGLALAFVVRALRHRPVEDRATRLLEDLREQLGSARPALRRASALASKGVSLAHTGAAQLPHNLERHFESVKGNLRHLFR